MEKFNELENNIKNINGWIESNPQVVEPNVYEIADCNVRFAQIISDYKKTNGFSNDKLADLEEDEPSILGCFNQLNKMDELRNTSTHPFFQIPEVNQLYTCIKSSQEDGDYQLSDDSSFDLIKATAIKKALSVSFYIWQVRRNEPNYVFDNISELTMLESASALLESQEDDKFSKPLRNLYDVIKRNSIFKEDTMTDKDYKSF